MKITIHPVKRSTKASNRFCGPAALSILTGLDTREIARLLRHVSGRRMIKGTHRWHLNKALDQLGYYLAPFAKAYGGTMKPTLIRFLKHSREDRGTSTFLIIAGHHYCVVQGRRYCCGQTGQIVPFGSIPHRRAIVDEVYRVVRREVVKPASVIPVAAPRPKVDPARKEATALAAHYGITLESVSMYDRLNPGLDGVFVYPPTGLYSKDGEDDPLNGNRGCYSWDEVLEAVKVYQDAIQAKRDAEAAAPLPALS